MNWPTVVPPPIFFFFFMACSKKQPSVFIVSLTFPFLEIGKKRENGSNGYTIFGEEETPLFSVSRRRISNSRLGRASVAQEASARLNKGSQNVRSGGTCYLISGRNDLGQPPEDSVYPVINNGAKRNI